MNIIFNTNDDKVEIKCTNAILSLGFNSDLIDLIKIMRQNEKEFIKSGKKKQYIFEDRTEG